ncbi:MAG: RHS repeat-associated core domain-containing protein [Bacilli bacterium]|nr:RHS repeat-associated core domain-containing protein [Bacilli bacterium]
MIKHYDETYNGKYDKDRFYSKTSDMIIDENGNPINEQARRPALVITYRNLNGLEDYMSYNTQSYTDGASYINNLTGNLTTSFNLNETIGGKYPISLSMIYNTNDVVLNKDIGYGIGYKLNLHETLEEVEIDGLAYLEYIDADGTIHYFTENLNDEGNKIDNEYIDEDGLGLTATKDNNTYIVTDKNNNKYKYVLNNNIYYLTELINTSNDKVTIIYNNDNKINKIIDANNSEINITYNSNNTIIKSASKTTTITYSNNQITSITTRNGTTNFIYNNNKLIEKIIDLNGLSTVFSYYNTSPYKIEKIVEYGLDNEIGSSLKFEYGFMVTRVIDNKGRYNVYSFNEQGNTVGVTNLNTEENLNNAYGKGLVYNSGTTYKEKADGTIFEKTSRAANSLATEILPVKYTKNLLDNSSFEEEGGLGRTTHYPGRTNAEARSGVYSLDLTKGSSIISYVEGNKWYTFSGYFKNEEEIELIATSQAYATGPCHLYIGVIPKNEKFTRYNFSFFMPENKTQFVLDFNTSKNAYLDDMQLEVGKIANYYNLLYNGDFSDGLTGWNFTGNANDGDGLITLENGMKALKVNPKPETEKMLSRVITGIKGEKTTTESGIGDMYYLSFWYKNTGIIKPSNYMMGENGVAVLLNFGYTDDYEFPGCAIPVGINSNNNEWQFYSVPFYADSAGNYENLYFNLFFSDNVNEFYITNISLTKDIEQNYNIQNFDTGNLDRTINSDETATEFKYDKNNQLTSMFNPKGNNFKFEYDNKVSDRVLKGISPTGISNELKYDNFGNPIKTLINNVNQASEILTGKDYHIRLKGTEKYWNCDFLNKTLNLKEDDCSHDAFTVTKLGDNYYFQIANLFIDGDESSVRFLNETSGTELFELYKQDNGSYKIRSYLYELYLCNNNGTITLSNDNTKEEDMQFYFEDINTPLFIESKAEYTEDGKFLTKTIDALGKETIYDVNPVNGLTNSVTDANEEITNYTYNAKDQITKVEKNNKEVNYTYNNANLLSNINVGNKDYSFTYDNFLNTKEVSINNQTLMTNEFEPNNGNLSKSIYGNGSTIIYTYDELDRIKTITNDTKTYTNTYDNIGNLARIEDNITNYLYYYDLSNRLSKYVDEANNYEIDYDYDSNNNITKKDYKLKLYQNLYDKEINFEYNQDDAITKVTFDDNNLNYTYDYLGRLVSKDINNHNKIEYQYISQGHKTSTVLKSMKINDDLYEYNYDNLYNITNIYLNSELLNHYEYDSFNQLISEDNYKLNKTYKYEYDLEGNILSKKEYDINSENLLKTNTYEYNNTSWEDQLTKFNNESITYDAIGNPITIGTKELTWMNGRQLREYKGDKVIKYAYNIDGIRDQKVVDDVITNYFTEGNKIIFETTNKNMIYYIRDEEGSLIGLKYNDKVYYYIKNMQEDVIGITDENFNKIVEYEYDSWGNIITIKDNNGNIITDESHIGIINPFRYRSYYYDKETKLYYLNSRYYNPEWGRFINCDSYLGVSEDILGYNLYIYVSNNPINNSDNTGQFLKKAWNWVKKKANQVKKTITKSVNAVKKVAKKAKESFVFEGEIGYGIGGEAGIGVVSVKAEATKTFGYSYSNKESKQYTSTSAGVGVTIIDYSLSASIDIRNYDNGTGNPMAMPWEIYNDENTFVDPNLGVSKELGTLEKSGSGGRFIGINFGAFLLIGGKIKIGFNF